MQPQSVVTPAVRARLQKCFEYGNQKMQIGDYDYATEMFAQCVVGDPSNILYMNSFIANLRVKFGNQKKKSSFGFLKKAARSAPIGKPKDLDSAMKDGVEKLKRNPWDAYAYVSMGLACLDSGFDDAGLAYLKHAVESAPEDVEINRTAAIELGERKNYENAILCWERVLKAKPDDVEAGKKISDLMMERTINRVQEAPRGAKEEERDEEKEKLSVEDQCEKRLRKNPQDRDAFLDLTEYFFQKGNYRKTEDACKRALSVFPDDDYFFPKLLEVQRARASAEFNKLAEQYKKNPTDALKAKCVEQKNLHAQKTFEYLQYRLKKSPNEAPLHWEMGSFLLRHGKYKEAIGELQKAKVDEGIAGQCLLALGQCFQQIKQYPLASLHYDQALGKLNEQSEDMKKALYLGARLAFGLNDLAKASKLANQLAAIDFSYKDVGDLLDKIAQKSNNK
ncbi:MAG: tetratricopeptide repeat protein [Thermoguttaceae bacterium]